MLENLWRPLSENWSIEAVAKRLPMKFVPLTEEYLRACYDVILPELIPPAEPYESFRDWFAGCHTVERCKKDAAGQGRKAVFLWPAEVTE